MAVATNPLHCEVCRERVCVRVTTQAALGLLADAYSGVKFVSHCSACGYCIHRFRRDGNPCEDCGRPCREPKLWATAADLPRPAAMGDDEFAFRAGLFLAWRTLSASEFVSNHLPIFADWLADRGHPEEAAARAAWAVYGQSKKDPAGWWQWAVPIAPGWVTVKRVLTPGVLVNGRGYEDVIEDGKARLSSAHNGGWFLCWPPGWVRFTAPLYHDPTRLRVTIQKNRSLTYSTPYEAKFLAGYANLFHPPGALPTKREAVTVGPPPTPSLFDAMEG